MIGAGLAGLTASIRLAEAGHRVELFEAAPKAGGRTRSFTDQTTGDLIDNGPHLLIGAYRATEALLRACGASSHVTWQSSLKLPLWDQQRGHFALAPSRWLPFPVALLLAVQSLPGHDRQSAAAMLRLSRLLKRETSPDLTVAELLTSIDTPDALIRDMLEPICLGAMNESIESASAATFLRVLRESFASASDARLGWFNRPLDEALIAPLLKRATSLGVKIACRKRIRSIDEQASGVIVDAERFDAAVVALPAYAAAKLLGQRDTAETGLITNLHLWYNNHPGLPETLIGGIGTTGHWFFDLSAQMRQKRSMRHICAVISADDSHSDDLRLVHQINSELGLISGHQSEPCHYRIVREKRATVLVRQRQQFQNSRIINAVEAPLPGALPATIEAAVLRGESAAIAVQKVI